MPSSTIRILAISGSLRPDSSSSFILKAMGKMVPENTDFNLFDSLDYIPFFCPGREETPSIEHFKKAIRESDGVVICTPEYAFGIPGVLKNGLDWLVSSGELNEKPVVVISVSSLPTGGDKALASLLLTLTALGTRKDEQSSLSIGTVRNKIDNHSVTDSGTQMELEKIITRLLSMIQATLVDSGK